jgi:hypothetical protein
MGDKLKIVTCPECNNEQADMGTNVACGKCGYGPMPTEEEIDKPKYVEIKMVFADWQRQGASVYQSAEGAPLSYGDFHSGSTFPGKIKLDQEEIDEIKKAIEQGFEPVFRIFFPK